MPRARGLAVAGVRLAGRIAPAPRLTPPGPAAARSVLVDARTGARVPFAGENPSTSVAWDHCDPVWQAGQPLSANGGLRRPATDETVMAFSGHRSLGCIALAGNELTGHPLRARPAPGRNGCGRCGRQPSHSPWCSSCSQRSGWSSPLRRSKRHGEDFLPMVLRLPF